MSFMQMVRGFENLVIGLIDVVLMAFFFVDNWLRGIMAHLGIPHGMQTAVLVIIGLIFFIGAIRLLSGVLRILLVVFIVLFLLHLLTYVPGAKHVTPNKPTAYHHAIDTAPRLLTL